MMPAKILSGLSFLLFSQYLCCLDIAIASPEETIRRTAVSQQSEYQEQLFTYLLEQKYTLLLGENRSACAYRIDPTDVYEQGNNRFVTALVNRGSSGTGCRGVLQFEFLQVDCESNTLYSIVRATEGDPRLRGWERYERSLSIASPFQSLESPLDEIEQPPADTICALSPKNEPAGHE